MAERHRAVAVMQRPQKQSLAVASRARVRRSGGRRVARCLPRAPRSTDAHLRPGIKVSHIWRWKEAADLDERGTLAGEIRDRIAGLLAAGPRRAAGPGMLRRTLGDRVWL